VTNRSRFGLSFDLVQDTFRLSHELQYKLNNFNERGAELLIGESRLVTEVHDQQTRTTGSETTP